MLLNAQPLNAAVLNASGAAPAQTLAASLQASATVSLAQARQGFALSASIQAAATAPTAQPGAAQPLGAALAASGAVTTSVLNRTSSSLAAALASGATAPAAQLTLGIRGAGQLAGAGTVSATLTWLVTVSGTPMAASAVVGSSSLSRNAGPLMAAAQALASITGAAAQIHALAGAVSASATVAPTLRRDNPIAAQVEVSASVGTSVLSLTNKILSASISATATATAPSVQTVAALNSALLPYAQVSYANLENTNRGRLAAAVDAAAYSAGDMPRNQRLAAPLTAWGFAPQAQIGFAPALAPEPLTAGAVVERSFLAGRGVLGGVLAASASAQGAAAWFVRLSGSVEAEARTFDQFQSRWKALAAGGQFNPIEATAEIGLADLRPGRPPVYGATLFATALWSLHGILASWGQDKQLAASLEVEVGLDGFESRGPRAFKPEPPLLLEAALEARASAVGAIIGGGFLLGGSATGLARIDLAALPLPRDPYVGLTGQAAGSALIGAAALKTNREELASAISAAAVVDWADLDKWPDIRLLGGAAVAGANWNVADLRSPIALLIGVPRQASAVVGQAGLGYVRDLGASLSVGVLATAQPQVFKALAAQAGASGAASGFVIKGNVLEGLFNTASAQVSAFPRVAYSLTAEAAAAAHADPDLRLSKRLESAHLVLAAVNGRLSVLYRGVEIDGPTAATTTLSPTLATADVLAGTATAELSADAIYADDIQAEYAAFLKAA